MTGTHKVVFAVFAHPDDEVLGAGATLALHTGSGDKVSAVFMTDGVSSRGSVEQKDARRTAAKKACDILGITNVHFLDFPDNALDSVSLLSVTQSLEKILSPTKPQIIYTHHHGDLNVDHRITHQAVLTACRPMPGSSVEEIYGCEIQSSTEWASPTPENQFIPNRYVDISKTWTQKKEALEAYEMEMRPFPHARSLESAEALATLRGTQFGFEKAEAFSVIRQRKTF